MESGANQVTRLRDWLNIDKTQLPDNDLISTINKNLENTPSPSSSYYNQHGEKKKILNEELIKHMSNLPSYLEKGDINLREKALSFGVLDWRHLEKWQQNHRQSFSPSSSNNDSSFFTTDISSTLSSRGQSCSPGETEVQYLKQKSDKPVKREHNLYKKYRSFSKLQVIKPQECEREGIEVQSILKMNTQKGKYIKQVEKLENLGPDVLYDHHDKGKHVAQSDDFESNHCHGIKQQSLNVKLSSESFDTLSYSKKILISPSRGKNIEDSPTKIDDKSEPNSGILRNPELRNTSPNRMLRFGLNRVSRRCSSLDLNPEPDHSGFEVPKLRNPSATRRFSIGLNRFGRRSSSLDYTNVPQTRSEISSNDKVNVGRKSQMSPLRRLLDPLLKPKAVNTEYSADSSENISENFHLQRPETSDGEKRSSTVQALVQMSIKNGLPLFTFADDKNTGILAATMKKLGISRKGDNTWIYTFFNVDEVKKKNTWINKKNHGYIPSVIAQMRVSDIRNISVNEFGTREFVSFSVDVRENDKQSTNYQPKDELAAILVKFPKHDNKNISDSPFSVYTNNSVQVQKVPALLGLGGSDSLFSVMVILPGGSHGVPTQGKPSSLIERWRSGGLCDCGGWDLGCSLNVLIGQAKLDRGTNFSDTYQAANRVELFPQGEEVEDGPLFILSPFKDHVYSVEFDSSLSFLQAFSICISILNCRKPYDLSEISKLFEAEIVNTLIAGDGIKGPYPPVSPVGRI